MDNTFNHMTTGEIEMIKLVVAYLGTEGYTLTGVDDGGELINVDTIADALEVVNSVQDSAVYLKGAKGAKPSYIALYVILGNAESGEEVISDCTDCDIMERATEYAEGRLQYYVESETSTKEWCEARDASE